MSRAGQLAEKFAAAHQAFYDFVKDATPEQWRARGINHPEITVGDEDENRPVGLIVHHVGYAYRNNRLRSAAWIRGENPEPPTSEVNRRHAADNADPDQAETLRFLAEEAALTRAYIAGLSDTDLAAGGDFVNGRINVEEYAGRILPYHIRWHMGSIRATWEAMAAG